LTAASIGVSRAGREISKVKSTEKKTGLAGFGTAEKGNERDAPGQKSHKASPLTTLRESVKAKSTFKDVGFDAENAGNAPAQ